jgi:hypothetical protein
MKNKTTNTADTDSKIAIWLSSAMFDRNNYLHIKEWPDSIRIFFGFHMMATADDDFLDDMWTLYFHDPSNTDWNLKSYVNLITFSSVTEYASVAKAVNHRVNRGMFFLMREHVFPCYDDKANIDGGCFTIKVANVDANEFWNSLCVRLLSDTLTREATAASSVNGISISPKRGFCIFKIWMATNETGDSSCLKLPGKGIVGSVMFKRWGIT